jgi:hypothetical protein
MALSLEDVFGPRVRFTMNSTNSGTTRSYRGFAEAARVSPATGSRATSGATDR